MPYIRMTEREELKEGMLSRTPGQLNYQLTQLLDGYIQHHGLSYSTLNAIIGALECTKMELYRRIAAPYEDKKWSENGDVYASY